MELPDLYAWEIQTVDGTLYKKGGSIKWQKIDPESVLRASLVPTLFGLERVDVFCGPGNRFVGWFGKGFLKQVNDFKLTEYAQCIETEQQRVWVLSTGRVIITHPGYNLRV